MSLEQSALPHAHGDIGSDSSALRELPADFPDAYCGLSGLCWTLNVTFLSWTDPTDHGVGPPTPLIQQLASESESIAEGTHVVGIESFDSGCWLLAGFQHRM